MNEIRIVYLNPRDLLPSRRNVRSDPGDLAGLAETIREHGILQPLGVTREGDTHRIVYGNRRRDAAIVVGLDRVPCIVLDALNDEQVVVQQVLENLQRLDLNDVDKSRAFEQLIGLALNEGLSQGDALEELARTLGLSARQIQRYLRLMQLDAEVQALITQGELGVTHGQHLVDIKPTARQREVAELAVAENLSAAELGRLCTALQHNLNIAPKLALEMLRRGERIPSVETRPRENLPHMGAGSQVEGQDAAPWDEEDDKDADKKQGGAAQERSEPRYEQVGDDPGLREMGHLEPATRDGNRVRKIHTMDAFMDELQRMTQCVQEGELQGFLSDDEAGLLKLRLAARQLRFLAEAVTALARASGAGE